MIVNKVNGVVKKFKKIPSTFNYIVNGISLYNLQDSSLHYADGFRELVAPDLLENQKLGNIIYDLNSTVNTYEVIDLTQEEIDLISSDKVAIYKTRIANYFSYMYIRALSSSMNKSSSDLNYLLGIREEYKNKYEISKGIVTEGVLFDNTLLSIQGEMEDEFSEAYLDAILPAYGLTPTGTHLQKMYQLIVFKYEYGYNAFVSFNAFVIRFRTKCTKWLDDLKYTELDTAFELVDDMPEQLTLTEAYDLFNEFNAI